VQIVPRWRGKYFDISVIANGGGHLVIRGKTEIELTFCPTTAQNTCNAKRKTNGSIKLDIQKFDVRD
jgi:hypothetical protein